MSPTQVIPETSANDVAATYLNPGSEPETSFTDVHGITVYVHRSNTHPWCWSVECPALNIDMAGYRDDYISALKAGLEYYAQLLCGAFGRVNP